MLFTEISLYGQIVIVFLGLLVIFPLVAVISIAIYKFFQVMRLPKTSTVGFGEEAVSRLGLTMADGGKKIEEK